MPRAKNVVIRRIAASDAQRLGEFFELLAADPDVASYFHPHPLSREFASELCGQVETRRDRYYVAECDGSLVAYSLLRGWDEGYDVPSFGGCIQAEYRNRGLGQMLLRHAVAESRAAGASSLRLTVYKSNARAVHVYRKLGFVMEDKNESELIGYLNLQEVSAGADAA